MVQDGELLSRVKSLYNRNLYVDAYDAGKAAWQQFANDPSASAEEMIWAGKVANRLGGVKYCRWNCRRAWRKEPDHPLVRRQLAWGDGRRSGLLAVLEDSLHRPDLDSGDRELDANWLADSAYRWAIVKDFTRSHELLRRARALSDSAWAQCMEAYVLLLEDRWAEALDAALGAWRVSPGMPAAADALSRLMIRMGRIPEGIEELSVAINGQSYECLLRLMWLICCQAERSDQTQRLSLAQRAHELEPRIERLTPLRDRYIRQVLSLARFDVATLLEDQDLMQSATEGLKNPVFNQIRQNLKANPRGQSLTLPYRAVFQKSNRCLPTSLAAIAGSTGPEIDADKLASELTYDGTSVWRAMRWLEGHGFAVRPFVLDNNLCRQVIGSGLPFIYLHETLDASHATAAIGLDNRCDAMLFHDPASERFGRVLLARMGEMEHPIGPMGIAFVSKDRKEVLDCIPDSSSAPARLFWRFSETMELHGPRKAGELLASEHGVARDSAMFRMLEAAWQVRGGQLTQALATLEALIREYPRCIRIQRHLLDGLTRTRNTARIVKVLEEIVHAGRMPGVREDQIWQYPPGSCITQYAGLLGMTAQTSPRAEDLLLNLLRREPVSAHAYRTLGDIYSRNGRQDESILPYRVASMLNDTDEHMARMAFESMRRAGRIPEGLDYLRQRVAKLGRLIGGFGPWVTLIEMLEYVGRPDEAIAVACEAHETRRDDPAILPALVSFWGRIGQWDQAERALEQLRKLASDHVYLQAAVYHYYNSGHWPQALSLCQQWLTEAPDLFEAHRMLAYLRKLTQPAFEVLKLTDSWVGEHPGDEDYEFLHHDLLKSCFLSATATEAVHQRLKRNPQDAWAWRELGYLLIQEAELRGVEERRPLLDTIQHAVEEACKLSPTDPATVMLKGRVAEMELRWEDAIAAFLEALRLNAEMPGIYARTWENAANLGEDRQKEILQHLEDRMMQISGPLCPARSLALFAADRFGADDAQQRVQAWIQRRGDDAELAHAYADVLLDHGQGRSDALKAIEFLEREIPKYPQHFDLRVSLAKAYGRSGENDKQRRLLEESIQRQPLNSSVRGAMAGLMIQEGKTKEAIALMAEGAQCNPQDAYCRQMMASMQWEAGLHDSAIQTFRDALGLMPENISIRQQLARLLCEAGHADQAATLTREGLQIYLDSPVLWHRLAETMVTSELGADMQLVEDALRKALSFNCGYFEAADMLARVLAGRQQFDEAQKVIRDILPRMVNASAALARLAWLTWCKGDRMGAIEELSQMLKAYPNFGNGWWQFMDALEEMDNLSEITKRLEHVPPSVHADPQLATRRIVLLAKCSIINDQIDAMWSQLLADFPRTEDVYLHRFDILFDAKKWKEAAAIVEKAEGLFPRSSLVLMRKVKLLAWQGQVPQAIEEAKEILIRANSDWAQTEVWKVLKEHKAMISGLSAVMEVLTKGTPIGRPGLYQMIATIGSMPASLRVPVEGKRLKRIPLLCRLAQILDSAAWDVESVGLANVLELLADVRPRFVNHYWKANPQRCQDRTRLWQTIAYMLVNRRKLAKARRWLGDWRSRPGVNMTAASYYRLTFGPLPSKKHLPDIYEHSRYSLEHLAHDPTAPMHVLGMCEALLRMNRLKEFHSTIHRYRPVMEKWRQSAWLPSFYQRNRTADCMLALADLLDAQEWKAAAACFKTISLKPRPDYVHRRASRHVRERFGLWRWLKAMMSG